MIYSCAARGAGFTTAVRHGLGADDFCPAVWK